MDCNYPGCSEQAVVHVRKSSDADEIHYCREHGVECGWLSGRPPTPYVDREIEISKLPNKLDETREFLGFGELSPASLLREFGVLAPRFLDSSFGIVLPEEDTDIRLTVDKIAFVTGERPRVFIVPVVLLNSVIAMHPEVFKFGETKPRS